MNERLMMRDRLIAQASDRVAEAHHMLFVMLRMHEAQIALVSGVPEADEMLSVMLRDHAGLESAFDLLSEAMQLITEGYE